MGYQVPRLQPIDIAASFGLALSSIPASGLSEKILTGLFRHAILPAVSPDLTATFLPLIRLQTLN
jgi:hypothetical protein